jgi:hypothetical protein
VKDSFALLRHHDGRNTTSTRLYGDINLFRALIPSALLHVVSRLNRNDLEDGSNSLRHAVVKTPLVGQNLPYPCKGEPWLPKTLINPL